MLLSLWPMPGVEWSLIDRLMVAANWHQVTSINAFNLWATPLVGVWVPDTAPAWLSIDYQTWGVLFLAVVLVLAGLLAWTRASDPVAVLWACFVVSYGSFELLTRMHERYLVIAIPLLAAAVPLRPRIGRVYVATTLLLLFNVLYIYLQLKRSLELDPDQVAGVVSAASTFSVLLLVGCLAGLVLMIRSPRRGRPFPPKVHLWYP